MPYAISNFLFAEYNGHTEWKICVLPGTFIKVMARREKLQQ